MGSGLDRRHFLSLTGAGALVTGFDPLTRSWVSGLAASPRAWPVPKLKGRLLFSGPVLRAAADDFGHLVHHRPHAVLEPGDIEDIAVMLRFCSRHQILAAPRGQGHATFGQAQVRDGLVIDLSPLDGIDIPDPSDATVWAQAGARWSQVASATLAHQLTPPVFTDYLELSVGGTLSAGGIGGTSPRYGGQVDNVAELDVVTGAGDRLLCSPQEHPGLFYAVLAGLGQCAVIVRARIKLVPAPLNVRHYQLYYPTADALIADQRLVQADGRFSFAEGEAELNPDGPGWLYYIEAGAYYGTTPPDDSALLAGLHDEQSLRQITTLGYYDFLDRLAAPIAYLKSTGEWNDPHPWWNMFLPGSVAGAFVTQVMANLTEADIGASGVILLYPLRRDALKAPLLRLPDEGVIFLFAVLRTAAPDSGGALTASAMLDANRELFEQARRLGGYAYPIGSIPTAPGDWRQHYGPIWPFLAAARRRYDPAGILTPGQGIFGTRP
jgi:FAD/FMN-containing dehydrogenase